MAIDASLIGDPQSLKERRVTLMLPMAGETEGRIFLAHEDNRGLHLRIQTPKQNNVIKHVLWTSVGLTEPIPDGGVRIGLNKGEIFIIHPPTQNVRVRNPEPALAVPA